MTPYGIIIYQIQKQIITTTRNLLTVIINNIMNTPNQRNRGYFAQTNTHGDVMNGIIIIKLNDIRWKLFKKSDLQSCAKQRISVTAYLSMHQI